jgi:hypothetical protein
MSIFAIQYNKLIWIGNRIIGTFYTVTFYTINLYTIIFYMVIFYMVIFYIVIFYTVAKFIRSFLYSQNLCRSKFIWSKFIWIKIYTLYTGSLQSYSIHCQAVLWRSHVKFNQLRLRNNKSELEWYDKPSHIRRYNMRQNYNCFRSTVLERLHLVG